MTIHGFIYIASESDVPKGSLTPDSSFKYKLRISNSNRVHVREAHSRTSTCPFWESAFVAPWHPLSGEKIGSVLYTILPLATVALHEDALMGWRFSAAASS